MSSFDTREMSGDADEAQKPGCLDSCIIVKHQAVLHVGVSIPTLGR